MRSSDVADGSRGRQSRASICYLVTLKSRAYLCHRVCSSATCCCDRDTSLSTPGLLHLSLSLPLYLSLSVFLTTSTTLRRFDGRKITNVLVLPYLTLSLLSLPLFPVTRTKMQLRGARRQCRVLAPRETFREGI